MNFLFFPNRFLYMKRRGFDNKGMMGIVGGSEKGVRLGMYNNSAFLTVDFYVLHANQDERGGKGWCERTGTDNAKDCCFTKCSNIQ
jgi:hypothetical protein